MNKEKLIADVTKLSKPIVEKLGYEFVEAKYEELEGEKYITIVIYNDKGITFDDCKAVSKALDEPLDELDPTNGESYSLNVSSLGLDRPIVTKRDFERFLNKEVEICLENGKLVGTILQVLDEEIQLKVKNVTKTIKLSNILKAMPYIKF
ncbi:MAG: ribosome maturation factor RimP [Christensenellales bacterium]